MAHAQLCLKRMQLSIMISPMLEKRRTRRKKRNITARRMDIRRIRTLMTGKIFHHSPLLSLLISSRLFRSDNTPLNLSKKLSSRSSTHHPNASTSRHPHLQVDSQTSVNNRRQRERTTFDPHEETPRLLQIFTDTKHPTRYQIASICETLNALPCRKGNSLLRVFVLQRCFAAGKKALEPYNIQYWFKNARAALKRKKRHLIPSDLENGQELLEKNEFESSDEDDDEENLADEHPSQDIIPTTTAVASATKKNYYSHYLQAFDISLNEPAKSSQIHSDESHDGSATSEQSPSIPFAPTTFPSKINHFDYNRSRRNRIFIDPSSEVPKLEQWFAIETHPDHILIERICSELNDGEYRRKFPKLESKHIRLWFKNHRAKVKRLGRVHQSSTNSNEDEEKQQHSSKHLRLSSSTLDDN